MAKFTVRVQLHEEKPEDEISRETYEKLHAAMEKEGFSRFRKWDNKTLRLPTAEYSYEGEITKNDVLTKAKRAAATTGYDYSVLVTEAKGDRVQFGLRPK